MYGEIAECKVKCYDENRLLDGELWLSPQEQLVGLWCALEDLLGP